jgi:hypothetical protein
MEVLIKNEHKIFRYTLDALENSTTKKNEDYVISADNVIEIYKHHQLATGNCILSKDK